MMLHLSSRAMAFLCLVMMVAYCGYYKSCGAGNLNSSLVDETDAGFRTVISCEKNETMTIYSCPWTHVAYEKSDCAQQQGCAAMMGLSPTNGQTGLSPVECKAKMCESHDVGLSPAYSPNEEVGWQQRLRQTAWPQQLLQHGMMAIMNITNGQYIGEIFYIFYIVDIGLDQGYGYSWSLAPTSKFFDEIYFIFLEYFMVDNLVITILHQRWYCWMATLFLVMVMSHLSRNIFGDRMGAFSTIGIVGVGNCIPRAGLALFGIPSTEAEHDEEPGESDEACGSPEPRSEIKSASEVDGSGYGFGSGGITDQESAVEDRENVVQTTNVAQMAQTTNVAQMAQTEVTQMAQTEGGQMVQTDVKETTEMSRHSLREIFYPTKLREHMFDL